MNGKNRKNILEKAGGLAGLLQRSIIAALIVLGIIGAIAIAASNKKIDTRAQIVGTTYVLPGEHAIYRVQIIRNNTAESAEDYIINTKLYVQGTGDPVIFENNVQSKADGINAVSVPIPRNWPENNEVHLKFTLQSDKGSDPLFEHTLKLDAETQEFASAFPCDRSACLDILKPHSFFPGEASPIYFFFSDNDAKPVITQVDIERIQSQIKEQFSITSNRFGIGKLNLDVKGLSDWVAHAAGQKLYFSLVPFTHNLVVQPRKSLFRTSDGELELNLRTSLNRPDAFRWQAFYGRALVSQGREKIHASEANMTTMKINPRLSEECDEVRLLTLKTCFTEYECGTETVDIPVLWVPKGVNYERGIDLFLTKLRKNDLIEENRAEALSEANRSATDEERESLLLYLLNVLHYKDANPKFLYLSENEQADILESFKNSVKKVTNIFFLVLFGFILLMLLLARIVLGGKTVTDSEESGKIELRARALRVASSVLFWGIIVIALAAFYYFFQII